VKLLKNPNSFQQSVTQKKLALVVWRGKAPLSPKTMELSLSPARLVVGCGAHCKKARAPSLWPLTCAHAPLSNDMYNENGGPFRVSMTSGLGSLCSIAAWTFDRVFPQRALPKFAAG
jgi:hypothetical protein